MCRISLVLLFVTYIGSIPSLLYRKEGSAINLEFRRGNTTEKTFKISKNNLSSVCYSFDGGSTVITDDYWKKRLFNCTITPELMSASFENFMAEDTGVFYLYNSVTNQNPLDTIELKIAKPVTTVTLAPTTITVTEGQLINLICTTSYCIPSAKIMWYMSSFDITFQSTSDIKENGSLAMTTSVLQKTASKSDNRNIVYCTASNIQGENVVSTECFLNVLYKPEVNSSLPNPYTVKEGDAAELKCTVIDANPRTNITWQWFINDTLIYTINDRDTYAIPNITRKRSGLYTCTAMNSAGTSMPSTIVVDVQYKPDVTTDTPSPYKVIEGETASLKCKVSDANPSTNISWIWLNTDSPSNILYTGQTYVMPMIKRNTSGSYSCLAKNSVGMSVGVTIFVDVQYKPDVTTVTSSPYIVEEGKTVTLECIVSAANPNNSIAWRWFNTENPSKGLSNTSTYTIFGIQRENSGTYSCNARNSVGTSAVTLVINVQYTPTIERKPSLIVNESEKVILTRKVDSNPLSNVYWFKGTESLKNQTLVSSATYIIENAICTDTCNFTLKASNGIGSMVTSRVELIVNCKPMVDKRNITLGVTDTSGINFSISILAHPQPQYALEYENGSRNIQMMDTVIKNNVNDFTINFNQRVVKQNDYGTYYLRVSNLFGETTVVVNVLPQRRPDSPKNVEVFCGVLSAKVQWKSAFNGGDHQSFTVIALLSQHEEKQSDPIFDKGESLIHNAFMQNLKPSVTYQFYIIAQNRHGNATSYNQSCTTLEKDTEINVPLIAGGAAGGGTALAMIILIAFVLLRRFTAFGKKRAGKSQRLNNVSENEKDEADVDGLKENSLYVSAGPRDDEKPEVVVYTAVAKKLPQSDNNSNLYADVKKSGRKEKKTMSSDDKPQKSLFKKDEKAKHKKGKKPKNRPGETDVYENSEDIALSTNVDNVYSNAGQKGTNKQEERGYKNKDGLLYVEVNFDGKQGQDNPVIHGEDEKTDYATVEFPMPSSVLKASCGEEL